MRWKNGIDIGKTYDQVPEKDVLWTREWHSREISGGYDTDFFLSFLFFSFCFVFGFFCCCFFFVYFNLLSHAHNIQQVIAYTREGLKLWVQKQKVPWKNRNISPKKQSKAIKKNEKKVSGHANTHMSVTPHQHTCYDVHGQHLHRTKILVTMCTANTYTAPTYLLQCTWPTHTPHQHTCYTAPA